MMTTSPTPEELAAFHSAIANKPSKQATKAFLLTQAMQYLAQTVTGSQTRQQRRLAAKMIARRLSKKISNGEAV